LTDRSVRCPECRFPLTQEHHVSCSRYGEPLYDPDAPQPPGPRRAPDELLREAARRYEERRAASGPATTEPASPEQAGAEVVSLSEKRWAAASKPGDMRAVEALRAALHAVESGRESPEHVIVIMGGEDEDGDTYTRCWQSGSYKYHAQTGLLHTAALSMWERTRQ